MSENCIVQIFGEIDEETSRDVSNTLIELSGNPTQEITLYINSGGGCVYSMFAIHDMIRSLNNPVVTIGVGKIMSAAALIFAAGDTRRIMPNATVMLHEPSMSELSGSDEMKVSELEIESAHMSELKERMYRLLGKYTGRTAKKVERDLSGKDFYLNAEESLEYGIADEICKESTKFVKKHY